MSLLQIYHQVCQRKNLENWLISGEVMGKSLVSCFFDSQCIESRKGTGLSGLHMDWSDWLVPEETFTVCGLVVSWLDMRLKRLRVRISAVPLWASCSHTRASVIKQYKLVPVKGR